MKKIIIVIIVLLILSSCGLSPNYSVDDIVRIRGKFLNPDGTPYAEKEVGMWIVSLQGLSLNNYWYVDPDDWQVTDTDGSFEFIRKGDAFITGNSTNYVVIANADSLAGPIAAIGFYPYDSINEIPVITLWEGSLNTSQNGENITFEWDNSPISDMGKPSYYTVSVRKIYYDLWRDTTENSSFNVSAYVFQNFDTGWRVEAAFPAENKQTDTAYHFLSGHKDDDFISSAPILLSAGKSCYIEGKGDTSFTKITNQIFHEWEWLFNDMVRYFIIDLEDEKTVNAVAVYGMDGSNDDKATGFEVYVSADTLNWGNPAGTTNRSEGYFLIDGMSAAGRYVKLQLKEDSDYNINLVKEISVFGE